MSPVLSAKVRRKSSQNEQLWHTLDIGNVFGLKKIIFQGTKLPTKTHTHTYTHTILLVSIFNLGELTHTLVPCWIPKPLPPKNECTCCFAPASIFLHGEYLHHLITYFTAFGEESLKWSFMGASLYSRHLTIWEEGAVQLPKILGILELTPQ